MHTEATWVVIAPPSGESLAYWMCEGTNEVTWLSANKISYTANPIGFFLYR